MSDNSAIYVTPEYLARKHHELWGFWMKILLLELGENKDGSITIPAEKVKEIKAEIDAEYDELSNSQKAVYEGTAENVRVTV